MALRIWSCLTCPLHITSTAVSFSTQKGANQFQVFFEDKRVRRQLVFDVEIQLLAFDLAQLW